MKKLARDSCQICGLFSSPFSHHCTPCSHQFADRLLLVAARKRASSGSALSFRVLLVLLKSKDWLRVLNQSARCWPSATTKSPRHLASKGRFQAIAVGS